MIDPPKELLAEILAQEAKSLCEQRLIAEFASAKMFNDLKKLFGKFSLFYSLMP